MLVPENFSDFLKWFKKVTEDSWSNQSMLSKDDKWLLGAKWIGMEEFEIDQIESKYQIKFTPDHREFLNILHTINIKNEKVSQCFLNWLGKEEEIKNRLNFPFNAILNDRIWLKSWGPKPESDKLIKAKFEEWYKMAPKLLPIYSHRYVVSSPIKRDNPVLSVWGADTIIYGWTLKSYLIGEFSEFLPEELFESVYDAEYKTTYKEFKEEIQNMIDREWLTSSYDMIESWGELIRENEGNWKYLPSNPKIINI